MSIKYKQSIIFHKPLQTKASIEMNTIINDYKQKLKINTRSVSSISHQESTEKLTLSQAKYIEALQKQIKTISFQSLYSNYQKNSPKRENDAINPEKMKLFRNGLQYKYSTPNVPIVKQKGSNKIKQILMQYFDRKAQQQSELECKGQRQQQKMARTMKPCSRRMRSRLSNFL